MNSRARTSHVLFRTILVCLLAAIAATALPTTSAAEAAGPRLDRAERAVVRVLNRVRARHGLPRIYRNRRLQRAADAHCRDMLQANFFAHSSSNGRSMVARVSSFRPSRRVGETLAYVRGRGGRRAARRVVRMWMNSPGHRAAILNPSFRRVGVARRIGRLGGMRAAVYTADFASRR